MTRIDLTRVVGTLAGFMVGAAVGAAAAYGLLTVLESCAPGDYCGFLEVGNAGISVVVGGLMGIGGALMGDRIVARISRAA